MRVAVQREQHVLEVRQGRVTVAWFPVGVGSAATPTPVGTWKVTVGRLPDDPDVVATLSTPALCCLRATHELSSLGQDVSGG